MVLLLISCLVGDGPTSDLQSVSLNSADQKVQGVDEHPLLIDVVRMSTRRMADGHTDHLESGTECRKMEGVWECRNYRSHHPFNRADLPDLWVVIPRADDWNRILSAEAVQDFLRSSSSLKRSKSPSAPRRGRSDRVSLEWENGSTSVDRRDAPESLGPVFVALNTVSKEIEPVQPRYQLQMGHPARVGLKEVAWLDGKTGLKILLLMPKLF